MSRKNNPDGKVHYSCSPPGRKRGKLLVLARFSCFLNHKWKNRGGKEVGRKVSNVRVSLSVCFTGWGTVTSDWVSS